MCLACCLTCLISMSRVLSPLPSNRHRGAPVYSRCIANFSRPLPSRLGARWIPTRRWYGAGGEGVALSARSNNPMERPMLQSNDLSRSFTVLNQDNTLIVVIEMSHSSWLVAGMAPGVERHEAHEPMAVRGTSDRACDRTRRGRL